MQSERDRNDSDGEELYLSPLNPQMWEGWDQKPISPGYSRIIFRRDELILRQIDGTEVPTLPDQTYFIDLRLLRDHNPKEGKRKQRKFRHTERWATHTPGRETYTPVSIVDESPYKRTVLNGIPLSLSYKLKDESGISIGSLTWGDTLKKFGITHVLTENEGIHTSYDIQRIVLIGQSYVRREYTIFFMDQNDQIQKATRKLP